ncbi:MAG: protoporphyrinogen oxidase [Lachnospiraceae bacterium]|nr:protoporphyrinogen oxidase [Lachnospiraceae bacterium]
MKYKPNEDIMISTRNLAAFLGMTDERVRQLEDEGVFTSTMEKNRKYFNLREAVETYVEYLKKSKASPGAINDEARRIKADADWKEAKADIEKMKRDELAGRMHSSEDVKTVTTALVLEVRSKLLSLPGSLAKDVTDANSVSEASGIIKAAVYDLLNELVNFEYDPKQYAALVRQREEWMNEKEE